MNKVVMLGFVISLSSTAVVIKLLEERGELNSNAGQYALGILLVQDILIVPMIIIIGYLGGWQPGKGEFIKQMVGAFLILIVIAYIL
ncbi:MAG: cation:proton antiporter, partial [Thermoplasmata archaeon]